MSTSLGEGHWRLASGRRMLGVIINDDLKPSLQCARAAAKANQVLGQIARGVCFRDKDNMLRLYETYGETKLGVLPGCLVTMDYGRQESSGTSSNQGSEVDDKSQEVT